MIIQNAVYVPSTGLYGASIDDHPKLSRSELPVFGKDDGLAGQRTVVVAGGTSAPRIVGLPTDYVDLTLTSSSSLGDIIWATLVGDPVAATWKPVRFCADSYLDILATSASVGVIVNMVARYWQQVFADEHYRAAIEQSPYMRGVDNQIANRLGLLVSPKLLSGTATCPLAAAAYADAQRLVADGFAAEQQLTDAQIYGALNHLYHSYDGDRPPVLLGRFVGSATFRRKALKSWSLDTETLCK